MVKKLFQIHKIGKLPSKRRKTYENVLGNYVSNDECRFIHNLNHYVKNFNTILTISFPNLKSNL